jgi:predicted AAA+ superfamily ATPase
MINNFSISKLFKVSVSGKNAVGKTSLIKQLAYGHVEEKVRDYLYYFSCFFLII